jgi:hypothetical protein
MTACSKLVACLHMHHLVSSVQLQRTLAAVSTRKEAVSTEEHLDSQGAQTERLCLVWTPKIHTPSTSHRLCAHVMHQYYAIELVR